jgi:solute carrier family 35 protein E3
MPRFYIKLGGDSPLTIGLLINIISSILIIQLNKYIFTAYGFPNLTLTCIHLVTTYLGLLISYRFRLFKLTDLPILKTIPISFTFCGFVALTNVSLQYNTIGTYQCLKSLTIPLVMIFSCIAYRQRYSRLTILSTV